MTFACHLHRCWPGAVGVGTVTSGALSRVSQRPTEGCRQGTGVGREDICVVPAPGLAPGTRDFIVSRLSVALPGTSEPVEHCEVR
jgi:hypothetical protein